MKLDLPLEKGFAGNAVLWKRVAAFLIDLLILNLIVQFSFGALINKYFPEDAGFSKMYNLFKSKPSYADELATIAIWVSIIFLLYFILLESKMQQSIGKKIMNVYVISTINDTAPKIWQHIARNLLFIPVFPLILLWVLDPVFMLFNNKNQRFSEILSKTRVMQKN